MKKRIVSVLLIATMSVGLFSGNAKSLYHRKTKPQ